MSYYINTEDSISEQLADSFLRDSTGSYSGVEHDFDFDEEDEVIRFSSPFQITPQYLRCLTLQNLQGEKIVLDVCTLR